MEIKIFYSEYEINYVKLIWVKVVQKSLQLMFCSSSVRQLIFFVNNNSLLRCVGMINIANVRYDVKFPYLIPKTLLYNTSGYICTFGSVTQW